MNFSCDKCGRKYSIPDDRVGDKGVKIRCKHCSHVITLRPPPASADESTRMVSLAELERGGVAGPKPAPAPQPVITAPRPRGGLSGAAGGKSARTEIASMPQQATREQTNPAAQSPWEGEATRAVVAPDPTTQWFAMVKGQQVGPFDMRGLSAKVKQGEVGLKTFVWRDGMGDWKRAEELPELALMFAGGLSKEEARPAAPRADGNRSLMAALQKSAPAAHAAAPGPSHGRAPTRELKVGEPLPEPRRIPMAEASPEEMWPAQESTEGGGAEPVAYDLSVDPDEVTGGDGDEGLPTLELEQPAPAAEVEAPARASAPADPAPLIDLATTAPPDAPDAPGAEVAAAPAAPAATDLGSDLFSDLDLSRRTGEHQRPLVLGESSSDGEGGPEQKESASASADPFAKMGAIPASMQPKPGEATNYIIAKAGVNRRNPAWKIAVFVVALIGLPVGILYLLSEMRVVPLEITRVDESTGQEVTESVFSAGGVTGLKDLLLGNKDKKKPAGPGKSAPAAASPGKGSKDPEPPPDPAGAAKPAAEPSARQLADLYSDQNKRDVGPAAAPAPPEPVEEEEAGGPPREEVARVVAQHQPAFQSCIEQELKKNPNFKGGKVNLMATVGSSGVVKRAEIDRKDINSSDLGECLKNKARRMSFAAFSGDEVELEIPLILTATM